MTDEDETQVPDDVAAESAFAQDEPPHVGADDDPERSEDLTTEDLAEGGPAGA
jgi:hypothetical protein